MSLITTAAQPGAEALAAIASLIGDPSRATMLSALLDGRALTAGELAQAAWIAPQTASAHLARLLEGGLLEVAAQGRHRYFRIAGAEVAHAIEALSAITPSARPPGLSRRPATAIRAARTCYDHLAGQLGVAFADALAERQVLAISGREFVVTMAGAEWFAGFGIELETARRAKRKFATTCLDWTERRYHVGGALGAALATRCFELGWVARMDGSRALRITVAGRAAFERELRLSLQMPA